MGAFHVFQLYKWYQIVQNITHNYISKPDYPLPNQCKITIIIYKAKLTSHLRNYHEKIYCKTSEGIFKQRYGNHKKSFNHEKHKADMEVSEEYSRLTELKAQPQVQCYILKRCRQIKKNNHLIFMYKRKTFYHWAARKRPSKSKKSKK